MKTSRSNCNVPLGSLTAMLLATGAAAQVADAPTLKDAYNNTFAKILGLGKASFSSFSVVQ